MIKLGTKKGAIMNKNIEIEENLQKLENLEYSQSNENAHSKVLAYFLRNNLDFLKVILEKAGINDYANINIENLEINPEIDGRKDVEIKSNDFILIIENKYKNREQVYKNEVQKQLEKYENDIKRKYPLLKKGFIYLRPFQYKLDENRKNWKSLTYKDILNILNSLKTSNEHIDRYKKIIERIYKPQEICKTILKEVLNLDNSNSVEIDDERGDINGYAIRIPLSGDYNSFLELEHPYPFCDYRDKVTINLTVKKLDITECEDKLLKNVRDEQGRKRLNGDKNYTWCSEEICKNKDFSEEIVREKLQNSKIIETLKKNHIF